MRITFEIRQSVSDINSRWMRKVHEYPELHERSARLDYQSIVNKHPNEYFELVKVVSHEECLAFTDGVNNVVDVVG